MNVAETALRAKDTGVAGQMYMAFDLSEKKWLLALSDGARGPSRYTVDAGDKGAVLEAIGKAKVRCALTGEVVVRSCYEAGRDGFWLHRWLIEQGIDNIVVDSASIEVDRRARRAKTDRLDGGQAAEHADTLLRGGAASVVGGTRSHAAGRRCSRGRSTSAARRCLNSKATSRCGWCRRATGF